MLIAYRGQSYGTMVSVNFNRKLSQLSTLYGTLAGDFLNHNNYFHNSLGSLFFIKIS